MIWEHIKSVILVLLITLSFVLTLIIWNYQPDLDVLDNTTYIHETEVSGTTKNKKELIVPRDIIFHHQNKYFSFISDINEKYFYKDIQKWTLDEFTLLDANQTTPEDMILEIILPIEIPIKFVSNLFSVNSEEVLPEGSFDRIYYFLPTYTSNVRVQFVSSNTNKRIEARIQNGDARDGIQQYLNNQNILTEYIQFNHEMRSPIYIPKNEVTLSRRTFPTNIVQIQPLINVLFNDPTLVRKNISNIGESYYTDGTRKLTVFQQARIMRFINPLTSELLPMESGDLIDRSIDFLNDHKGWTNDYQLFDIDGLTNTIKYRTYFNGYPVYDDYEMSVIEQSWRSQEIFEYNRSLIQLTTPFESEDQKVSLIGGQEVIYYLQQKYNRYFPYLIEDIEIGYEMSNQNNSSYVMTLEPSWFIKFNNRWEKIVFEETVKQGGDEVAVGSD